MHIVKEMSLTNKEYGDLKGLYALVYSEKINIDLIDEIVDELVEELISEGVEEEEAYALVEEATDTYIDEAKVTFGSDTAPIRKSGALVGARRRYGMRKAGDALQGAKKAAGSAYKTAKSKAASAAVDVAVAGSMAKDSVGKKITATKKKASEVKQAVQNAPGKAREAASDAKKKTKSGIKGFIKRQAQKVVSRMSEENVEEIYKGKHGQTEKQYQDSRSDTGKMISGDSKMSGSKYAQGRRTGSDAGPQPAGGSKKPASQGKMDSGSRTDLTFRKAALKKEELEATGLFSDKEIEAIMEAMSSYDKNRKRAAQRAADRNAARDAGKTGVVPGVGYVTPRREKETYTDEQGTVRHKSGAKNE